MGREQRHRRKRSEPRTHDLLRLIKRQGLFVGLDSERVSDGLRGYHVGKKRDSGVD